MNNIAIAKNTSQEQHLVSIYWDYENMPNAKKAKDLLTFASLQGYLLSKKVYANWNDHKYKKAKEILDALDFDCITVSHEIKNAVDFYVSIDCSSEASSSLYPHIFIIVTGDGYSEILLNKLRDKGKKVIIVAREDNDRATLKNLADEFHFLEDLPSLVAENTNIDSTPCKLTYTEAVECLVETIKTCLNQGKRAGLGFINGQMCKLFPNYEGVTSICKHEGKSFSRFSSFVKAVEEDGIIRIENQELFLI